MLSTQHAAFQIIIVNFNIRAQFNFAENLWSSKAAAPKYEELREATTKRREITSPLKIDIGPGTMKSAEFNPTSYW